MSDFQEKETWIKIAFIACLTAIRFFHCVCVYVYAPFGSLNVTVRHDEKTNKKTKWDRERKRETTLCACVLFKYKVV